MSDSLELIPGSNNLNANSIGLTGQVLSPSADLLGLPNYRQHVSSFSSPPQINPDSSLELIDDANILGTSIRGVEDYYYYSTFPNSSTSYTDTGLGGNIFQDILGESESDKLANSIIESTLDTLTGETINGTITGTPENDSIDLATLSDVLIVLGSLRADNFTFEHSSNRTVFSGNGNVDFGSGKKDILDLSSFSLRTVDFNLAKPTGGGVIFNPGNGDRVFDAITLTDGSEILFEGIDSIKFADTTIDLSVTPNDSMFKDQWNLHMMGVHNAWAFTTGSTDVLIGVQDTGLGVNTNGNVHNDLLGRTTRYLSNYADDFLDDTSSHGTAVQGIIAANSNNGIGMSGINWNSNVFHIDVIDGDSKDRDLAQATQNMIDQANSKNQRLVINMSLSVLGGNDPKLEQLIANNINNALFVIASGNDDASTIDYPSSLAQKYTNVIAVGASWGTRDYYNNEKNPGTRISYPGWWGSNYGNGLTLMGPSEVIAAEATKASPNSTVEFGYEQRFNGTSAATPNVAGVASLVWSANRNLTASQIKGIMSQTAYDLGTPGYDTTYGYGFVNADAAVRRAIAMKLGSTSQNGNQA
ncbi:S8 family serine peptidase [Aerosakkonemataceae cyanobacterium BLCC-F50]|uniref:S8 family serine peptidase n=1 Tax=Floridaenema flaviceps BLCC-F50 TaxID=3153642 RepID=A0ABV4Y0B4_9CYAN